MSLLGICQDSLGMNSPYVPSIWVLQQEIDDGWRTFQTITLLSGFGEDECHVVEVGSDRRSLWSRLPALVTDTLTH